MARRVSRAALTRSMAERGVAQGFRGGQEDLARNQAIVVDAANHGEFRARIDHILEDSAFVDEAEVAVEREMIADDDARVVHPGESSSVPGVRIIDGGESPVLPQESAADAVAGIASDN